MSLPPAEQTHYLQDAPSGLVKHAAQVGGEGGQRLGYRVTSWEGGVGKGGDFREGDKA